METQTRSVGREGFDRLLREQELRPLKDRINELEQQCSALKAKVKRMQPLVQAARLWANSVTNKESLLRIAGPLMDAVDEYEIKSELKNQT